jgi:hypothetical protein
MTTDTPALNTSPEVLCMALTRYALRNSPYAPGYLDENPGGEWYRREDVIELVRGIVATKEARP